MRCCEGLIDSLLYIIKTCVNTSDYDSKVRKSLSRPPEMLQLNELLTDSVKITIMNISLPLLSSWIAL